MEKNHIRASGPPPPPPALFISHVLELIFSPPNKVNLLVNNSFFSQITLVTKLRGLKFNGKKKSTSHLILANVWLFLISVLCMRTLCRGPILIARTLRGLRPQAWAPGSDGNNLWPGIRGPEFRDHPVAGLCRALIISPHLPVASCAHSLL